ncbi:phosphotransferase [Planctomycetota bacterium]|nr:phosphotransferase [Planctomycetota bacterium]
MSPQDMTMMREKLEQQTGFRWLDVDDVAGVKGVLQTRGWIGGMAEIADVSYAGEGNMNLVMRVIVNEGRGERRLIMKQGRPWVEKYPEIAAPWDRVEREWHIYRKIRIFDGIGESMPGLVGFDPDMRLLVLEDLGEGCDLKSFYDGRVLNGEEIDWLSEFLKRVHGVMIYKEDRADFSNESMRLLNHEYMFMQPLDKQRVVDERLDDLENDLVDTINDLKRDEPLREAVGELGEIYLSDECRAGDVLLHGDFYPGSWHWPIKRGKGRRGILDWEFSFVGNRGFDVGVYIAHMAMSNHKIDAVEQFLDGYGWDGNSVMSSFAGNEVIRRIAGVAQLPIEKTNEWRSELLKLGRDAVVHGDWRILWG